MFKTVDPEYIPIFVAHDLNKLPPITFDHVDVTRLLKDILKLQNEIQQIKNTYVTTEQLLQTKEDLMKINDDDVILGKNVPTEFSQAALINSNRNINFRRGACLTSFDYVR